MTRLLHRIWLGPDPMPAAYASSGRAWKELNPQWTVKDWTEETLPPLKNRRIFQKLSEGAVAPIPLRPEVAIAVQRADIASYELLFKYGGVYVNCDIEPLRPLEEDGSLIDQVGDTAWAAFEDAHYLNNAAMGATWRKSPFWGAVIAELPKRFDRMPGSPMNQTTGPHLLTDVYKSRDWGGLFTALPRESFHFAHFSDVPLGGNADHLREGAVLVGAIGLHSWNHRSAQARTDLN
jgi:mannosyltransferase OCH1-like enzyme